MPASSPNRRFRSSSAAVAAVAAAMSLAAPARAVVIQTLSGTDNTTAPADDPGFANVGYSTNGLGTAIYLGNGWVLTAGHVGGGGIVLASGTYLQASGSNTGYAIRNLTPETTEQTDLYLYKLATEPVGLPMLPIASSMPGGGAALTMIGGGLDRGDFTKWVVTESGNWVPVTGTSYDHAGFGTLGTRAIRWGTNNVEANDFWANDGLDVKSFASFFDFDPHNPYTTEAQAVLRDSGGAVFTKAGGQWQLAGVIYAVSGWSGQPNPISTAVFGDVTYMADLSFYRPQIVALVPEPSSAAVAWLAAATLLGAWTFVPRRRRR